MCQGNTDINRGRHLLIQKDAVSVGNLGVHFHHRFLALVEVAIKMPFHIVAIDKRDDSIKSQL
jgi:hypothetical protein